MSLTHDPQAIRASLLAAFDDLFGSPITRALADSHWFDSTVQTCAEHGVHLAETTALVMALRTGSTGAELQRLDTCDPDKVGLWFSIAMDRHNPHRRPGRHDRLGTDNPFDL
ncbi:hypothetical protein [Saccharothrix sp. HUAS TT1]|uniref:hypothetical protein n=1 Tax=unclassified Saccharothrix TaxID=2593673 RepID=UPI00345C4A31